MKLEEHLKDIAEIRSMMERASKFLSLSGLSGISVGLVGLLTAGFAYWYLSSKQLNLFDPRLPSGVQTGDLTVLIIATCAALFLAIGLAILFSTRMAKKKGLPIWSPSTKHLLIHLFVPLLTGALFCITLLHYEITFLIAPAMLIFYGLALLNASKFTLNEVLHLGYAQIGIGVLALFRPEHGLLCWALGFGVLHILNGVFMYFKYEK